MNSKQKTLLTALVAVAAVCFIALIIFPNFIQTGGVDQAGWCHRNLLDIDAAIGQWALENKKPDGTIVTTNDILPYLPHGKMPKCPVGGHYILTKVGEPARCSVPTSEHKLVH